MAAERYASTADPSNPRGRLLAFAAKEPLLRRQVRRPLETLDAGETQVRAERLSHRVHEPCGAPRREAVLPPDAEHRDAALVPVDSRLDPADEAIAVEDRKHVVAEAALRRGEETLPHVLEAEHAREKGCVPQQRVERGDERDRLRPVRRRLQQLQLLREDEALAAQ